MHPYFFPVLSVVFLIIANVAYVFGARHIAGLSARNGNILLVVFMTLSVVMAMFGVIRIS